MEVRLARKWGTHKKMAFDEIQNEEWVLFKMTFMKITVQLKFAFFDTEISISPLHPHTSYTSCCYLLQITCPNWACESPPWSSTSFSSFTWIFPIQLVITPCLKLLRIKHADSSSITLSLSAFIPWGSPLDVPCKTYPECGNASQCQRRDSL